MFYPFLDYKTVDFSYSNEGPTTIYTVEYRCLIVVEMVTSNANTASKGICVYADNLGYKDDPIAPTLYLSGFRDGSFTLRPGSERGSFPFLFNGAGARIRLIRANQYGSCSGKLHVFRLP